MAIEIKDIISINADAGRQKLADLRKEINDLRAAIANLDERYSITLSLRYVENLSIKEVASMLGIEEKSVYTRLERGKKKLLEQIEGRKS